MARIDVPLQRALFGRPALVALMFVALSCSGSPPSGDVGAACGTATCAQGGMCCYACISECAGPGESCKSYFSDPCASSGSTSCSKKSPTCSSDRVCDLSQPGHCTASTAAGTCIVKPQGCALDYVPVCGCDGKTYGNDCSRQSAGAQLDHTGECP